MLMTGSAIPMFLALDKIIFGYVCVVAMLLLILLH
jgi:hypothetical protein